MTDDALVLDDLRVELRGGGGAIVDGVSLRVSAGEILGIVGESGSGKTTTALALLGYCGPGARITSASLTVAGHRLDPDDERRTRRLRGRIVSYVPQDPASSLNPALRIGRALRDMLDEHRADVDATLDPTATLAAVDLPADPGFLRRFPHQLSGGQQQRVMIAMSLTCQPPLVVLDEPTTGLDVVTQAHVLEELRRLRIERSLAMVYVSHDLAVVSSIADRVAVMYAGRVVEEGPTRDVLEHPRHPYTCGLVESIPDHLHPRVLASMPGTAPGPGERPPGCAFEPRCGQRRPGCVESIPMLETVTHRRSVRCFEWRSTPRVAARMLPHVGAPAVAGAPLLRIEGLAAEHRGHEGSPVVAASGVSFALARGGCTALVGESGSGKTTIARCVVGLHAPSAGEIVLDGVPLAGVAAGRNREQRRLIQLVFQNPYDSLNPRQRVADEIARPARVLRGLGAADARAEVAGLLERVRLPARAGARFPGELSGGERQRVAIARALAAHPALLVCDEVTSALDVSVQAAVLELLHELRRELGVSLLFISHDLGVVASIADNLLVLERGVVCEEGAVGTVLASPGHPYTRRLLEAAPRLPDPDEPWVLR